jgi:MFS family permease
LAALAVGGLIYGPFTAVCTALVQRNTPPQALSRVLAARTALTTPATALGTLVGGPIVTAVGARHTLLGSALLTIALGASVAALLRHGRRGRYPAPTSTVTAATSAWVAGRNAPVRHRRQGGPPAPGRPPYPIRARSVDGLRGRQGCPPAAPQEML